MPDFFLGRKNGTSRIKTLEIAASLAPSTFLKTAVRHSFTSKSNFGSLKVNIIVLVSSFKLFKARAQLFLNTLHRLRPNLVILEDTSSRYSILHQLPTQLTASNRRSVPVFQDGSNPQ